MYDFVNELGYLALATRLKRISEAMVHSGRQMYKSLEIDVEPNWYLIFKLLKKYKKLSVTQVAAKLHFSHPSVITLLNKMESASYLTTEYDQTDSRRKFYKLTQKAEDKLPMLEKIWDAGTEGVKKLFKADSSFLEELEMLEVRLSQHNFMERTLKELNNE